MAFVRYSVMTPRIGQAERVNGILDRMLEYQRGRDGFIAAYHLRHVDHGEQLEHGENDFVGRVSVWESEAQANAVAVEETNAALQSELKLWTIDETHEERSFSADAFEPVSA